MQTEESQWRLESRRDAALSELAEKHRLFYDLGKGTLEDVITALDAVTLAHLAATFKWSRRASQAVKELMDA
jgi:hypothetical protein